MLGFEYIYTSPGEIMQWLYAMNEYSLLSYTAIVFLCLMYVWGVYFLFPYLYVLQNYYFREREKRRKKEMIRQIALQKDIEFEIENEMNL